jgi:aspartate aminotransferase-like enzyme
MLKKYLLAPGPTQVPEEVLLEMAKPIIHHRTTEFSATFKEVSDKLKILFGTDQQVLILAGSGTAAMEAAMINTMSKNDTILVVNAGKFGARWIQIAEKYDINVISIDLEWGYSVKVEQIKEILEKNSNIKAVFIQGSETSTTASHPVKEIAELLKNYEDTIFVVDGITSVGVVETKMDEWGIDILVTGSQKALMLPPGLAFISLSQKAWKMAENSNLPKYYLDLKKEKKSQANNTTAYTPAVSLINGLNKVLEKMLDEGFENVYKRHEVCRLATTKAVKALGFELLAKDIPSSAATGIILPENLDGGKFVKYMRETVGITFAGGQDHLKGKILRISHLGYHDVFDTLIAISAFEMGLKKFGIDIELGKGVKAAQEVIINYLGEI